MPNPWDVGSARLLASLGFEALATTSAGFAWSLGKLDQQVTRDELVAHVAQLAAATTLPLNVDSERCYPDDPGGVAETVRTAGRGRRGRVLDRGLRPGDGAHRRRRLAAERVAEAAEAAHASAEPMVLTGRRENHIRGVTTSTTRSRASSPTATPAPTACMRRGCRPRSRSRAVVDAVGVPGERPRAPERPVRSASSRRPACGASRRAARSPARRTARCSRQRTSCSRRARRPTRSGRLDGRAPAGLRA